jgi:NAD(P)-dependent dehydrogenase (short-subunit alcohol dehydrogenase family)
MFQPGLLKAKKILVTGGGTGLGASMGHRFLELGAELVICGRRKDVLEETAARFMKETGGKVTALPCDVRDASAVEAMMDAIWTTGPLDALVNNAAGNFIAQTHKLSPRAIDAILNTVLHGAAYCTVAAGRRWIEAERRARPEPKVVLSILTLSALRGAAFRVPSAMAKAGVLAMTRSLAVEWGPKGIRTVAIAPGPFPTEGAWQRLRPKGSNTPTGSAWSRRRAYRTRQPRQLSAVGSCRLHHGRVHHHRWRQAVHGRRRLADAGHAQLDPGTVGRDEAAGAGQELIRYFIF